MFHIFPVVMTLYVLWRVIWPLPCHRRWRILLSLLVFLMAESYWLMAWFAGSMAAPNSPSWLLYLSGWGFGSLLLTALCCVLFDLLALPVACWRQIQRWRRGVHADVGWKWLHKGSWLRPVAWLLMMAITPLGVWQAVQVPEVRKVDVAIGNLPAGLEGLRVVQLTDLHASPLLRREWVAAVVEKTQALRPDLILITGDLVDGSISDRRADVEPLSKLSAPMGVYVIVGNHEYYSDYVSWVAHFRTLGLTPLINESRRLVPARGGLVVAGISDQAAARFSLPMPNLAQALSGVSAAETTILLSHRPAGARLAAEAGVDLQLSGHTHGGHVWGMHWLVQWANEGFVSGLYAVGDMALYVGNGAGLWNGFPLRLGRPSEITLLTLHRR